MEYIEFADRVMQAAARLVGDDHSARLMGVPVTDVAQALEISTEGDFWQSDGRMAILHVGDDLDDLGLASVSGDFMRIEVTERGRAARETPLRTCWRQIFEGITLDDEQRTLLRAAVARSEDRRENFALMQPVSLEEVFAELGWPPEMSRIVSVGGALKDKTCLTGISPQFPIRPTYLGVVLATREAETADQRLLKDLLDDWETTTTEVKRELVLNSPKQKHEFVRDILALGTTQGRQRRHLIVGFDPKTRTATTSVDPALRLDDLENILNAHVRGQPPALRYRSVPWAAINTGLIEVIRDATVVPYRGTQTILDRFGADVFIRRLSHVAIATPDEIAELEAEAAAARLRGGA